MPAPVRRRRSGILAGKARRHSTRFAAASSEAGRLVFDLPSDAELWINPHRLFNSDGEALSIQGRDHRAGIDRMCIDHRGLYVLVAKQLLHRADIGARLKQMRGEGMPEGVWPNMLDDPSFASSDLDCFLYAGLEDVMAANMTRTRVF